ncbi:hypothetical protein D4100_08340 [Serratia inhibens]|uniref:Uncharacterized protein n=1 Tax=Serratia inhibens TaxID=2338073 RepID=A0AA92X9L7_9GAMM|nr:hypothetical protein D4100_08340 [Serratia inhibens]
MTFELQPGNQFVSPQALTSVSNWGERTQATTLRLERRRVLSTSSEPFLRQTVSITVIMLTTAKTKASKLKGS